MRAQQSKDSPAEHQGIKELKIPWFLKGPYCPLCFCTHLFCRAHVCPAQEASPAGLPQTTPVPGEKNPKPCADGLEGLTHTHRELGLSPGTAPQKTQPSPGPTLYRIQEKTSSLSLCPWIKEQPGPNESLYCQYQKQPCFGEWSEVRGEVPWWEKRHINCHIFSFR